MTLCIIAGLILALIPHILWLFGWMGCRIVGVSLPYSYFGIAAVVIMVCCFSVNVEVTTTGAQNNTAQIGQEEYNSDAINNNDNAITTPITSTTMTIQTTTTTSQAANGAKQKTMTSS